MIKCPNCLKEVEPTWNFCKYCRFDLKKGLTRAPVTPSVEHMKVCPACGTNNDDKAKFCAKCGLKLIKDAPVKVEPPLIQTSQVKPDIQPSPVIEQPKVEFKPAPTEPHIPETPNIMHPIKPSTIPSEPKPRGANIASTSIPSTPAVQPDASKKEEENFEFINWIKNHGLRTIDEIKEQRFIDCDALNSSLFGILSEIREYNEWTAPDPVNDKTNLIKYGNIVEEYANSIDCKKFDNKPRCKSIIQTFIKALNEAIDQLVALI